MPVFPQLLCKCGKNFPRARAEGVQGPPSPHPGRYKCGTGLLKETASKELGKTPSHTLEGAVRVQDEFVLRLSKQGRFPSSVTLCFSEISPHSLLLPNPPHAGQEAVLGEKAASKVLFCLSS